MSLAAGTRLGPYEIVAPLGAGGMGEVYRAKDTRLGRDVAIKVLPAHLSDDRGVRARFEREAKIVSSLNHPHICTLFDVGREGAVDYLVMELVEGESLAQRLAGGALPTGEVLRLGAQIADALSRAHRSGVIHRDLKPGNVMLTKAGAGSVNAKLMDFGLAQATGLADLGGASDHSKTALSQSPTRAQPLTVEGTLVGTYQYMAPEQLEGAETDARSDVWALGCLLYEMATGRRAFTGRSHAGLISVILKDEPPPLAERAPSAPPALERIIRHCLAKSPDDRIQTAHDVWLQLEGLAHGDPGSSSAGVGNGARPKTKVTTWAVIGILVAVTIAVGIVVLTHTSRVSDRTPGEKTIAVLPFENHSPDKRDSEYGDWLSELIGGLLGKTSGLRVISQTSAAAFKGKTVALPQIAKQLGVTLIVEGSVRSEGDDIVISAQLIDAVTDMQVWASVYKRKTDHALAVQSEVAAKVANAVAAALNVTISEGEQQALDPTGNPQAYEAYQKALKLYSTARDADVRDAQRLLNEAVALDPEFALAWALLSRVHSYFYFNRTDATEGRRAAAEHALKEALRLKPDLADVLLADAYYTYWVKRDYEGSRARFERLMKKWPNNGSVLIALASITRRQARWVESRLYFARAVAIDPLRLSRRVEAAGLALATRDFAGAMSQLDASLDYWPDAPDNLPLITKKAQVYQALGRLDDAGALLAGLHPEPDGVLVEPIVYQAMLSRRQDQTIRLLQELLKRDQAEGSVGRTSIDLNLDLGNLRHLAGDAQGARFNYREALDELRVEVAKQPESADVHSYLALAYCGLGDRAAATKHAALAVETVPVSKDAWSGAYYLDVQARVWARLGNRDAAIPAIERLMKMSAPEPLTPALLRLDPDFDKLRTDARFKALLNGRS